MEEIKLFKFEGNEVRTLKINDEPYFVGKDVAEILGYSNTRKALQDHVDLEDKKDGVTIRDSIGRSQRPTIITESGLYSLILSSKMPNAKRFKHWVTSEVLPAIRKHGAYMTDAKAFDVVNNKNGLADLLQQAADQLKQKDIRIEEMETENRNLNHQLEESNKKASYLDLILGDPTPILITQIANDYGYSAVAFNRLLKKFKVQRRVNGQWILYKAYMGKGYTSTKSKTYQDKHGNLRTKIYTVWTQKGRRFIYDILKENDILPLIEREDVAQEVIEMTILAAMSTKELWSKLCDLLIQRMALDTTKEEWEKLTEQTNKIDAELKRRGELLSQEVKPMELLNTELLQKMITKIVRTVVREELAKRGSLVDQKMFNRKDAARYLGVSGSYIDSVVKRGQLDPTLPGSGEFKFYLREDLDKFAESGKSYLKRVEK